MKVTKEILDEIAISKYEYDEIVKKLHREPNHLELGLFGALWSEHCGYKHTKKLLKKLSEGSDNLPVKLGEENAGVIDIGEDISIVMKIESHNHPSAIEPFQGAATGVGGIIRDIFAMGARPIALLNSLRFGIPENEKNKYIINGVVSGISYYGNCIGIPNIGGEVYFSDTYQDNPLVNAMCVGVIKNKKIMSAKADQSGDLLVLVGSDTGRDGIHGASGLASKTFHEQDELRSTVQVGNPFLEKILIESCLEAIKFDEVVGLQDCGAAGITSAAIEMADRSNLGLQIDVSKIPQRETEMNAYELMLSESQERMLLAIKGDGFNKIKDIFQKWDIKCEVIGKFINENKINIYQNSKKLSSTPISALTNPPLYDLSRKKPAWLDILQKTDLNKLEIPTETPKNILLEIISSPNIASKKPIFRQYDHHVQTNTVIEPGGDGALLRIKGSKKGISLSTDSNGKKNFLDPNLGTQIAVAEACRNISCTGAKPVALTDGLNFGDPEKEDVQYQLTESIDGLINASKKFNTPVISGNASLYNESNGKSIYPTTIIGAIGIIDNTDNYADIKFKEEGDLIVVLGDSTAWGKISDLSGSEYLEKIHKRVQGQPEIDLDLEIKTQKLCRLGIKNKIIKSAHDVSDGGIAINIIESCISGGVGAIINEDIVNRWDAALFGETQSKIVISISTDNFNELVILANQNSVPYKSIGYVGGESIKFSNLLSISLEEVENEWGSSLEKLLK
ncbi:MAG: phosphoribosylformylglycinamidine synthase II [Chloroflexi bacterium]|nr:phosphoribosylformylglycinamidine synthase II [Chloroflexota bacterium]